jgi:hypothetical protein
MGTWLHNVHSYVSQASIFRRGKVITNKWLVPNSKITSIFNLLQPTFMGDDENQPRLEDICLEDSLPLAKL